MYLKHRRRCFGSKEIPESLSTGETVDTRILLYDCTIVRTTRAAAPTVPAPAPADGAPASEAFSLPAHRASGCRPRRRPGRCSPLLRDDGGGNGSLRGPPHGTRAIAVGEIVAAAAACRCRYTGRRARDAATTAATAATAAAAAGQRHGHA